MYTFEDLEIWKVSRHLRNQIREMSSGFPNEERYSLTSQILRSSRSVTANVAEGFGRFNHQENIQFCRIARGSLFETLDHLICANDCQYISNDQLAISKADIEHCLKLLNGYIAYLKKAKATQQPNNSITNNSFTSPNNSITQ